MTLKILYYHTLLNTNPEVWRRHKKKHDEQNRANKAIKRWEEKMQVLEINVAVFGK